MFDTDTLHPSHLPMSIAADLSNASELLKRAEALAQRAMRGLQASYGASVDALDVKSIGDLATAFSDVRDLILKAEADEQAERLRHARAL